MDKVALPRSVFNGRLAQALEQEEKYCRLGSVEKFLSTYRIAEDPSTIPTTSSLQRGLRRVPGPSVDDLSSEAALVGGQAGSATQKTKEMSDADFEGRFWLVPSKTTPPEQAPEDKRQLHPSALSITAAHSYRERKRELELQAQRREALQGRWSSTQLKDSSAGSNGGGSTEMVTLHQLLVQRVFPGGPEEEEERVKFTERPFLHEPEDLPLVEEASETANRQHPRRKRPRHRQDPNDESKDGGGAFYARPLAEVATAGTTNETKRNQADTLNAPNDQATNYFGSL